MLPRPGGLRYIEGIRHGRQRDRSQIFVLGSVRISEPAQAARQGDIEPAVLLVLLWVEPAQLDEAVSQLGFPALGNLL